MEKISKEKMIDLLKELQYMSRDVWFAFKTPIIAIFIVICVAILIIIYFKNRTIKR